MKKTFKKVYSCKKEYIQAVFELWEKGIDKPLNCLKYLFQCSYNSKDLEINDLILESVHKCKIATAIRYKNDFNFLELLNFWTDYIKDLLNTIQQNDGYTVNAKIQAFNVLDCVIKSINAFKKRCID